MTKCAFCCFLTVTQVVTAIVVHGEIHMLV